MASRKAKASSVQAAQTKAMARMIDDYARLLLKLEAVDAAHARATEKQRKKLGEMLTELRELFSIEELRGCKTDLAQVLVTRRTVPNIVSWQDFLDYVMRNRKNAADLLRKQVSSTAYNERLKAGKTVPGLEPMNLDTVIIKPKRS